MTRMLFRLFSGCFLAACLLAPGTADAYDGLTFYGAELGAQDRVNSKGVRLTGIRDLLQQDRANFHRFNRRDPQDQQDGYFRTKARCDLFQTARITVGRQLLQRILDGSVRVVTVWVYDRNSIEVTEGLPNPDAD